MAVVCGANEDRLDSVGLWLLLWGQVSDSLCSESEDLFWSMILEELPSFQGFPVGSRTFSLQAQKCSNSHSS